MALVSFQINAAAWLEKMGTLAAPGALQGLAGARVEELQADSEAGRLRVVLSLDQAPEDATPFQALREALRVAGFGIVELRVRYGAGAVSLGEYLALHFDDLCTALGGELKLEPHWLGALDYQLEGEDQAEPKLTLRSGRPLALKALRERRGAFHVGAMLAWGCGTKPQVLLEDGEPEALPDLAPPAADAPPPPRAPEPPAAVAAAPAAASANGHGNAATAAPANSGNGNPYAAKPKAPRPERTDRADALDLAAGNVPIPGSKLLEGKPINAALVKPMDGLREEGKDVAIEGDLFELVVEPKGKKGSLLAKLSLTDGTDSLQATWWVPEGKAAPKELAVGRRFRARGELKVNTFENNELVLELKHLMLLPSTPRRQDLAPDKRVELHAHTKMSASDGLTEVEAYVTRAFEWGHAAVGITDHGVVHSFPAAAKTAKGLATKAAGKAADKAEADAKAAGGTPDEVKAAGKSAFKQAFDAKRIKLLLGMEAYLVEDAGFIDKIKQSKDPKRTREELRPPAPWHCIVYIKSDAGRRQLYELVSHSHTRTFYKKPLIDKALLKSKREGLILGSACEAGELYSAITNGAGDEELKRIASFYDYLEVQPPANNAFMVRNGSATEEQLRDNVRRIVALGQALAKPVVATSDLHFLDPGDEVYRRIMQSGQGFSDADLQAPLYFRTTQEMLDDMAFLGPELAYQVTVEGPRAVAALCEHVPPVKPGQFFPVMDGADESIRTRAFAKARLVYGEPLPELVEQRLQRELDAVIGNKFGVLYEIARLLVVSSNEKGYSVGSRGSVGSSFAAYCLGISEVNPLPSHEHCQACRWIQFRPMEKLAGVDLPARACPQCGAPLTRDGYNIPFETFVGFKGDKVPDIDLNFAPEVQNEIQKYAETLFGKGQAFKAGTVSTLADKQAFGFVKKYFEAKVEVKRRVEVERLKAGIEGVKTTSGQHPGGVVLVPVGMDINEVTPVQFSGDKNEMGGAEKANEGTLYTTHFDYHAYDETLVKLDILGKDDGSAFRHLQEMTGVAETAVPLDDPAALSIFSSGKALGLDKLAREEKDWLGETGAVALPEFGTANTRRMLEMARPKTFTDLIYISGLSHGTGVWAGNAEKLIADKTATLDTVISTRDDIMNRLIQQGMAPVDAYDITEKIRKGAVARDGFKPEQEQALALAQLPKWWIDSCRKIQYMFPKAHATAYCFTAMRMAWFKTHHPAAFYCAWLTLHADEVDSDVVVKGKAGVLQRLRELKALRDERKATAKEEGSINALVVVLEALCRGIQFLPVDLYKSQAHRFMPVDGVQLLPPLVSLAGLGENAARNIDAERALAPFRSIEELARRCGLNKTVVEKLTLSGALKDLPRSDQADLFGF
jgi:DNA polymerase-3 subunit alpha (Gram-positive type)